MLGLLASGPGARWLAHPGWLGHCRPGDSPLPLPQGCTGRIRAVVPCEAGNPAAMAGVRSGYTRSMIISVVDCADMQQAWRDAFAEVEYRNGQARLAASAPRMQRTGMKQLRRDEASEDEDSPTPERGGRNAKRRNEDRTSRGSASRSSENKSPTPSQAPTGRVAKRSHEDQTKPKPSYS